VNQVAAAARIKSPLASKREPLGWQSGAAVVTPRSGCFWLGLATFRLKITLSDVPESFWKDPRPHLLDGFLLPAERNRPAAGLQACTTNHGIANVDEVVGNHPKTVCTPIVSTEIHLRSARRTSANFWNAMASVKLSSKRRRALAPIRLASCGFSARYVIASAN